MGKEHDIVGSETEHETQGVTDSWEMHELTDAVGSGHTLESLGFSPPVLGESGGAAAIFQDRQDADGRNLSAMHCRHCGTLLLPKGKVSLEPALRFMLPVMPGEGSVDEIEDVRGFWHVKDKAFSDTLGSSIGMTANGALRYILCAKCGFGPVGWFKNEQDMHVAAGRVKYGDLG